MLPATSAPGASPEPTFNALVEVVHTDNNVLSVQPRFAGRFPRPGRRRALLLAAVVSACAAISDTRRNAEQPTLAAAHDPACTLRGDRAP